MTIDGVLVGDSRTASLTVSNGRIDRIDFGSLSEPRRRMRLLCPGFIDLQVNGLGGIAFNDPALTTDQIGQVTRRLWQTGVALYCPTLITDSHENLRRGLAAIARARGETPMGKSILGIHLEGPYLSAEDGPRGAHPPEHVRSPDWEEFLRLQQASDGLIRLVTLAPELPGAIAFIERLVSAGVRVALGHTAADSAQIAEAIRVGACMSTHLGNAAHDRLQRHRNYVYDQLAADDLWASFIVDGHHLPPELVKIFVRAKRPERVIMVSDAAMWAGLPAGIYPWGHCDIEVRDDGWIGIVGQPRLAGSGLLLYRGVENVVRFAGASLPEAVRMVSENPARMLGMYPQTGTIQPGSDAHVTVVEWDDETKRLSVCATIVAGDIVWDGLKERS